MKKFLKAMLASIAVIVLAVTLAGCTANVSGKTYVYSEVKMELPDDASTLQQGLATTAKGLVEEMWKNAEFTFKEDGTVTGYTAGKWTQDGKKVTVTAGSATTMEFTVNGSKLEQSVQKNDFSFTVVYTKK